MKKPKPDMETCICGDEFEIKPGMILLELKLCQPCFKREAYIILLIHRTKELKRERPYPVRPLIQMKEYHAIKTQLIN